MDDFLKMLSANPAEWTSAAVAAISSFVGVFIALMVRRLAHLQEKIATTQNIYGQWMKKKELSIEYPSITKIDALLYSGERDLPLKEQQVRVWFVLIIDILFNSFAAAKGGLYPEEVYREDMRAHMGRLLKYDAELVLKLMEERGYVGSGILDEFHKEVEKLLVEISTAMPPFNPPNSTPAAPHAASNTRPAASA